jgi:hypothetical protein
MHDSSGSIWGTAITATIHIEAGGWQRRLTVAALEDKIVERRRRQ